MKNRAIIIWIVCILLLGIMGALLFNQSNRNEEQLEQQASRNILLVKSGLEESEKALKTEIRSFINYQLIRSTRNESFQRKRDAAKQQNRDTTRFKFQIQEDRFPDEEESLFGENLALRGFSLTESLEKFYKEDPLIKTAVDLLDNRLCKYWLPKQTYTEIQSEVLSTRVPYSTLFKNGLDRNTFYDYLVLVTDKGKILYPDELRGIYILDPSKDLSSRFGKGNVNKFETHLTSELYQGYITRLSSVNQNIWVAGLKKNSDLLRAAYRIDYNLLTLIILLLTLLLLSLPIISFLDLSKGDVLTMGKVYRIGVSLMLVFMAFGWATAYFTQKPEALCSEMPLADTIKQDLSDRFRHAIHQLNDPETLAIDTRLISLNELITSDSTGKILSFATPKLHNNKALDFGFINISHREYFKYYFKNVDTLKAKIHLERIFSQKDSKPEQIISSPLPNKTLGVITFSLEGKTLLSKDRRFLLVKSGGEVVYSSEKFEFLFPNIKPALSPKKWNEFQSITANNISDFNQEWQLGVHLNGQEYLALISRFPLDHEEENLWYIYLVNKNIYHSQAGIISLESLFWILGYLSILAAISLLQRLFKNKGRGNWERFTYQWISPHKNSDKKYLSGIIFCVSLLLFFLLFPWVLQKFNLKFTLTLLQHFWICLVVALISLGWMWFAAQNKEQNYVRYKLRTYPLFIFFWLMAVGFLPTFWITHVVFSYEHNVWENILDTKEPADRGGGERSKAYYTQRSMAFNGVLDAYDPQLRNFIFPNYMKFVNALGNVEFKPLGHLKSRLGFFPSVLGTLVFLGICFGLCFLLRILLTRIYWMDLNLKGENAFSNIVREDFSRTKHLKLFLCGCDSSEIRFWIYSALQIGTSDISFIDCARKDLSFPRHGLPLEKKKVYLIENLHCLTEPGKKLMEVLSQYQNECAGIHLIISSGIAWRKIVGQLEDQNEKIKLSELMNGFYFEYVPLRIERDFEGNYDSNFDERELESHLQVDGLFDKKNDKYQRVLLQRYGKAYFYNIWSELSIEEQSICYSFSKEGFLNYTNSDEVTELCQKGVIVRDPASGKLHLFSKTFRYFIMANISEMKLGTILNYQKSHSNSGNTQWAILSFLLVAVGLLAYFERTFLTEIQALVTSASGVISLVFNETRKYLIKRE